MQSNKPTTSKLLHWHELTLSHKAIALFDFFETATYPLALLMPVVMLTSGTTGSSLLPFSILLLSLAYAAIVIYQELFQPNIVSKKEHISKIFLNGAGCMFGLITTLYWALELPLVNGLGFYFAIALSLATGLLAIHIEAHREKLATPVMTNETTPLATTTADQLKNKQQLCIEGNYHPACLPAQVNNQPTP